MYSLQLSRDFVLVTYMLPLGAFLEMLRLEKAFGLLQNQAQLIGMKRP